MLKFRDDINLLRALAVIFVVLFHFKIPLINNGFAGVDIFFVISGYLMTAIIFRDFGNSFSWHKIVRTFYLRRFSRIVPALLALVILLWVFSYFEIINFIYQRIVREIAFAITFFSNVNYFRHTGYFDIGASKKWLLHTWSLSVEMQFYLFYPLVLIITKKILGVNKTKWVVLLLFIASLASSIYYAKVEPSHAYYLLGTRAWQLLAGGVVFLFPLKFKSENIAKVVQYLAVLLLIVFIFLPSFELQWMGIITVLPIILAMLLLYSNSSTIFSRNRVLKQLGLWSYSLYLWHWVIVVYLHYLQVFDLWYMKLFGIAFSVLFSAISYYTVERKFKYKTLITFILFVAVIVSSNYAHKYKKHTILYSTYLHKRVYLNINGNNNYVFLGDSHLKSLLYMFKKIDGNKSMIISVEGCFFGDISNSAKFTKECKNYNNIFFNKYLEKNISNKQTLFWIQSWSNYSFNRNLFNQNINLLSKKFKKVLLLLDTPFQKKSSEDIYYLSLNHQKFNNLILYNNSISLKKYKRQQKDMNNFIRKVASKYKNVIVLDPTPYVCDKHRCPVGTDKVSYYADNNHLTDAGALRLLPLFEPFFKEAKKRSQN